MRTDHSPGTPAPGRSPRRWRAVALLAAGIAIGVAIAATPVSGHIGTSVTHLWNAHIKPKTDARYYTKGQANARYAAKGAKAPDAELLDGLDSSALLQGEGRAIWSSVSLAFDTPTTVLSVEGVLSVTWFCSQSGGSIFLVFNDSSETLNLFGEFGGFAPLHLSVAPDGNSGELLTGRNEDMVRLHVGSPSVGVFAIELAVAHRAGDCLVQTQGVQTT